MGENFIASMAFCSHVTTAGGGGSASYACLLLLGGDELGVREGRAAPAWGADV